MKEITKKDLLERIERLKAQSAKIQKDVETLNRNLESMTWFVNLSDDPEKLNKAMEFAQYILRVLEERATLSDIIEADYEE